MSAIVRICSLVVSSTTVAVLLLVTTACGQASTPTAGSTSTVTVVLTARTPPAQAVTVTSTKPAPPPITLRSTATATLRSTSTTTVTTSATVVDTVTATVATTVTVGGQSSGEAGSSGSTIIGHAQTANGQPISNATIEFKSLPDCPGVCTQIQTRTNSDGDYTKSLPAGYYVVLGFFTDESGWLQSMTAQQKNEFQVPSGDHTVDFVLPNS